MLKALLAPFLAIVVAATAWLVDATARLSAAVGVIDAEDQAKLDAASAAFTAFKAAFDAIHPATPAA